MQLLSQDLNLLEARGLVRVATEREKPFIRFKHALTREATYNTILQSRRAELHRAAAQTLAALYAQPDLEMVLTIAEHWQRGNEDGFALETLLPHAQTLIYTGRSISLTTLLTRLERENLNETQTRDLEIALADAHAARGEYPDAKKLYELVLGRPTTDALRARLLHSLGVAEYHLNANERAIDFLIESVQLARQDGNLNLQARASSGLALAYWNQGDHTRAEENLQHSLNIALQLGESIELANAEFNLAGISMDRGVFQTAIEHAERALMLYEKLGHAPLTARTTQMLGACYYGLKDLPRAMIEYRHAISKSRELGDNFSVALGLGNLAEVYTDQNELDHAVASYTETIQTLRALKYDSLLAYYLAYLASVQIRLASSAAHGDTDTNTLLNMAERNVQEAFAIAQQIHSQEDKALAKRVLAELYAARADWENARVNAQQAITLLQPLARAIELERAYETQQRILTALGLDQTQV